MSKYKTPICKYCGSELEYFIEEISTVVMKINKNGKLSKRKKNMGNIGYNVCGLRCTNFECRSIYEDDFDEKDRVIAGDLK